MICFTSLINSKKPDSFLVLLICLSLLRTVLSTEAKNLEDFNDTDKERIAALDSMVDDRDNVLSESETTCVLVNSEDTSQMLFYQMLEKSKTPMLELLEIGQTYTDQANKLDFPFSQKMFENFNVNTEDGDAIKVYLVVDRYRGDLMQILDGEDTRFFNSMTDLSQRVRFYWQMARVFSEISKMKQKYCNWGPHSFLYKEEGVGWMEDYVDTDDFLEYFPALGRMQDSVDWKGKCGKYDHRYADPEDVNGSTNSTDSYREVVEQHPLALIILQMEVFMVEHQWKKLDESVKELTNEFLKSSEDSSDFISSNLELTEKDDYDNENELNDKENDRVMDLNAIFNAILKTHEQWLTGSLETYSHDLLKVDLEFLMREMKFKLEATYHEYDSEKYSKVMDQYGVFLGQLLVMVRKNNMMSGRSSNASVVSGFSSLENTIRGFEAGMKIRRLLLV